MDTKIVRLLAKETKRQNETITLIPSENYASSKVRKLVGSVLMNKYSEGYPGKRYYQGNKIIDEIEMLAVERAKKLFNVPHANVQPYSGSPANSAVLFALCAPGDTILGMELSAGGHLTHGHPKITFSGRYFQPVQFGLRHEMIYSDMDSKSSYDPLRQGLFDYDAIEELALKSRPKVIFIGPTAYPLILDWQKFAEIANLVGAFFVADISHVAGLVVAGVYPSPAKWAHVLTTTTHKTLRGPRGAIIMATDKGLGKNSELGTLLDRAVFPGLQGGPHDNTTAAVAQALAEASHPGFRDYGKRVVENAQTLARVLKSKGLRLVGNGTETHLILIDLKPQGVSGNIVAEALEVAGIVVNKNTVWGDTSPFYPSGIRLGTPAVTTRGMGEVEMKQIAGWILKVISYVQHERLPAEPKEKVGFMNDFKRRVVDDKFLLSITKEVKELCQKFPAP